MRKFLSLADIQPPPTITKCAPVQLDFGQVLQSCQVAQIYANDADKKQNENTIHMTCFRKTIWPAGEGLCLNGCVVYAFLILKCVCLVGIKLIVWKLSCSLQWANKFY